MMTLVKSNAVVTGAGSGIGAAIAAGLAARGCKVLVADIDQANAEDIARAIGNGAAAIRCDVRDHSDVERLADFAEAEFGRVDLVFANAGVSLASPVLDSTPEGLEWVFGVNFKGVWSTASVFGRRMRDSGRGGRICITASEHALGMQFAGAGLYTASKHAVLGLADVLRSELPDNMTVSVLCPGLVSTNIHLAKRHSPFPMDDADAVAFAGAIMAKGMDPAAIAAACIDGVVKGEFLIVTHPTARPAAERRWGEINDAFTRQAPWSAEAERYDVNHVLGELAGLAGNPFSDERQA